MRIGFISTMAGDPWGGSEEQWVQTARLTIEEGHTVIASVYDWGATPEKILALKRAGGIVLKRQRIFYQDSVKNKIKGKIIERVIGYRDLRKILSFKPDRIVFSQGTIDEIGSVNCIKFIKRLKIPYFIISQLNTEYNTISYWEMTQLRDIFKKSVFNFFVSNRNLEVARRQFCMNFTNGLVVHNPVNLERRVEVPWPDSDTLIFAHVARLDNTVKGQSVLLQILSTEKWKNRNWELRFYGTGKDEKYLRETVGFYNLGERVKFYGYVNDITKIWKDGHVLLLPSTIEGMPLALIEAMVCGRPAVVTDVGGNAELVDEGITGFIAEAPSVNSFSGAMERMWESRNALRQMGRAAADVIKVKVMQDPCKVLLSYFTSSIKPENEQENSL